MTPFSYEGVHWPITRWVSNYKGLVTISGVVQRLEAAQDLAAGWPTNGCLALLYLNADSAAAAQNVIWQQSLAWYDGTAYSYQVTAEVNVGDALDFVVDPYSQPDYSQTAFTAQIVAASASSVLPADSVNDFVGNQGNNGWYYGERFYPDPNSNRPAIDPTTYTAEEFQQLTIYDSGLDKWYGPIAMQPSGQEYTLTADIAPESMTPFSYDGVQMPITRWVSDYQGVVIISGIVQRLLAATDAANGWPTNGSTTRIYDNANGIAQNIIWQQNLAWNDGTAYPYQITLPVAIGDVLDFEVDEDGQPDESQTEFTAHITAGPGIVAGTVYVNATGNPTLAGATVQTPDGAVSTVTGANGGFTLDLPNGENTLQVSAPYVLTTTQSITLPITAPIAITVNPNPGRQTDILVTENGTAVGRYDYTTGTLINGTFASMPQGLSFMTVGADGYIYLTANDGVYKFDQSCGCNYRQHLA